MKKHRSQYSENTPWLAWGYYAHAIRTHGLISEKRIADWLPTTKAYGKIQPVARNKWLADRSRAVFKTLSEWGVGR